MDDLIRGQLESLLNGVSEEVGGIAGELAKSPADWNPTIWSGISKIAEDAVMPVATLVLAFFFCLELYGIVTRHNSGNPMNLWEPAKAVIKVFVIKTFLTKILSILLEIFKVIGGVITATSNTIGGTGSLDIADLDELMLIVNDMSFWPKIGLILETFIGGLMIQIMSIIITVIIFGRMIEIFVYSAVAPIPVASCMNNDLNIGKNFLKAYVGLAVQGFVIMVIISIYGVLVNNVATRTDIHGAIWDVISYSAVLIFCLFKSGAWSKSIMNAA